MGRGGVVGVCGCFRIILKKKSGPKGLCKCSVFCGLTFVLGSDLCAAPGVDARSMPHLQNEWRMMRVAPKYLILGKRRFF